MEYDDIFKYKNVWYKCIPGGFSTDVGHEEIEDGPLLEDVGSEEIEDYMSFLTNEVGITPNIHPGNGLLNLGHNPPPPSVYYQNQYQGSLANDGQQYQTYNMSPDAYQDGLQLGGLGAAVPSPQQMLSSFDVFLANKKMSAKMEKKELTIPEKRASYQKYAEKILKFKKDIAGKFKAGGVSETIFTRYAELLDSMLGDLMDAEMGMNAWTEEAKKYHDAHQESRKQALEYHQKYDNLQATHLDIVKFNSFCQDLYKTLKVRGPKMETMQDVPKLVDVVYMQAVRQQAKYEPEVP